MKDDPPPTGATGRYPNGSLGTQDDGEIKFSVGATSKGKVVVDFGTTVVWMALEPQEAADLGAALIHHARTAARVVGTAITVTL